MLAKSGGCRGRDNFEEYDASLNVIKMGDMVDSARPLLEPNCTRGPGVASEDLDGQKLQNGELGRLQLHLVTSSL